MKRDSVSTFLTPKLSQIYIYNPLRLKLWLRNRYRPNARGTQRYDALFVHLMYEGVTRICCHPGPPYVSVMGERVRDWLSTAMLSIS
jgi:hypothetical protein